MASVKSADALFRLNGKVYDGKGLRVVERPRESIPIIDLAALVTELKNSISAAGRERDANAEALLKKCEDMLVSLKSTPAPAKAAGRKKWRFRIVRDAKGRLEEIVAEPL